MHLAHIVDFLNTDPDILEIALRLACAMLVGLVIGTEREYTNRPAGMRTHILVALGACVVSVTGELLFHEYKVLGATPDPARLSAQVITGVGFLGAGTIMREGMSVKGLTTAASVWSTACLGVAAGFGYYTLALVGMILMLLTLTFLEVVQKKLINSHNYHDEFILETDDIAAGLETINTLSQAHSAGIQNILAQQYGTGHRITFEANFGGAKSKKHRQAFFEALVTAREFRAVRRTADAIHSEPRG